MLKNSIFFDQQDHELLHMINTLLEKNQSSTSAYSQKLFDPALHPHGIKELAVSNDKRIAYAVMNLLDSLEVGQAKDRIIALHALHDEVILGANSNFRYNTGRVLIQIMKELIRSYGDQERQLKLAHDFRAATSGKRRVIRYFLRRYYLLEMPEEWNQITFDHHVHDANTKGRKSPTHMIMDAWIKGIRTITVIYYNYVPASGAQELMQAAQIMDIEVHIGVEYKARFRDHYVSLVWEPTGFIDDRDMLDFLNERPMQHLMQFGKEASHYQEKYVYALLERYNQVHRLTIEDILGINMPKISSEDFMSFVGSGQPSRLHLASCICQKAQPSIKARHAELVKDLKTATVDKKEHLLETIDSICQFDPDEVLEVWLSKEYNAELNHMDAPADTPDTPEILRLHPATLVDWLTGIRANCRIILNLTGLNVEDVLEILYDCEGLITHIELFNLKDYADGSARQIKEISALQQAINSGSPIVLKRCIHSVIRNYGCALAPIYTSADTSVSDTPQTEQPLGTNHEKAGRCAHLTEILRNIPRFKSFYQTAKLKSVVGSDSAGRSTRLHGMGFVCPETLPKRAQKQLRHRSPDNLRQILPLEGEINARVTYTQREHTPINTRLVNAIRSLPGCRHFMYKRLHDWVLHLHNIVYSSAGNIATLGGFQRENHLLSCRIKEHGDNLPLNASYLNTIFKNALKVSAGFVAAFLTFQYTQDWWVLAWFGPVLWFGITGFRNIVQAVLGGGGLSRSPLLRWNNFISWNRLCDSLMYTGISVPLLELVVRYWFLQNILGITTNSSPWLFFTVVSVINGLYISGHNLYRGLPKAAIVGNLFRSVLAIPVSMLYNELFIQFFSMLDPERTAVLLLQAGAIISKISSDTVAGIIEGLADRADNFSMRHWDCTAKLRQLFDSFASLELLLPEEEDVLEILARPKDYWGKLGEEVQQLEKTIIINSLDLMYFWFYQPRGKHMLTQLLRGMTEEERSIICRSQLILSREQEVSRFFVDGIVGRAFSRPLSFYLESSGAYLKDLGKAAGIKMEMEHSA